MKYQMYLNIRNILLDMPFESKQRDEELFGVYEHLNAYYFGRYYRVAENYRAIIDSLSDFFTDEQLEELYKIGDNAAGCPINPDK